MKKWFKRVALVIGTVLALAMPAQAADYTYEFVAPEAPVGARITRTMFWGTAPGIVVGDFQVWYNPNTFPMTKEGVIYRDGTFETATFTERWNGVSGNGLNMVGQGRILINGVSKGFYGASWNFRGVNNSGIVVGNTSSSWAAIFEEAPTTVYHKATEYQYPGSYATYFFNITEDGQTVFGVAHFPYGGPRPMGFTYDVATGQTTVLPNHPDFTYTQYTGMSPDGSLFVGRLWLVDEGGIYSMPGFTTYNGSEFTTTLWPDTPGPGDPAVEAIDNNGVIVGWVGGDCDPVCFHGLIATPVVPTLPEELAIDIERYKLVYDQEWLTGMTKLGAKVDLLPEGLTTLPDGTVIQSVVVTIVFPGLGEGGVDLVLTDQFDVIVTDKPGVFKLDQIN